MKSSMTTFLLFVLVQFVYSQNEKRLHAIVVNDDFALQGIEVANLNNKNIATTNSDGLFSILGKAGDTLVIISQHYFYKTIMLKNTDFDNPNFIIALIKKPEELEEVVVFKLPTVKKSTDKKYEQGKLNSLTARLQ